MKSVKLLFVFILSICIYQLNAQISSQWRKVTMEGPSARSSHTMTKLEEIVYLFGGMDFNDEFPTDMWTYAEPVGWMEIFPNNMPPPRYFHAACIDGGKLYITGGITETGTATDIWEYNPTDNDWAQFESTLPFPNRSYYSVAILDNKIWFTGGMLDSDYSTLGEIWGYDLLNGYWQQGVDCPSPRYGHTTFAWGDYIYMSMGRRDELILSDMWRYHIYADAWEVVPFEGTPPIPTKFPAWFFSWDLPDPYLWMAGGTGYDDNGNFIDLNASSWYEPAWSAWSTNPTGPSFSFGAASGLPNNGKDDNIRALVFGGTRNGEALDETWIYDSESNWNLVSIEDLEQNTFNADVGVSKNRIHITSNQTINKIEVYNMQGGLVLYEEIGKTKCSINAQSLSSGVYFTKIWGSNKCVSKKIILIN